MEYRTNINWFPGHMAKTRRLIAENLRHVDIVFELLDSRIPDSSKNPEIKRIVGDKPVLTLLNKASLASPPANEAWVQFYKTEGLYALVIDCITGEGISGISAAVNSILQEKLERYAERGMSGRRTRAMIVGIPNVGKSSLINRLSGGKRAKVEDRPGVTLRKQWVSASYGLDLLDMPGVLWPKFDDKITGENLALTGSIKDDVLDIEEIAMILCGRLRQAYKEPFFERYKLQDNEETDMLDDYDLFELIGRRRGCLLSGGGIDHKRTAVMLLDEFRGGKVGRISLELPPQNKTV